MHIHTHISLYSFLQPKWNDAHVYMKTKNSAPNPSPDSTEGAAEKAACQSLIEMRVPNFHATPRLSGIGKSRTRKMEKIELFSVAQDDDSGATLERPEEGLTSNNFT